jgi:hypothetical protein
MVETGIKTEIIATQCGKHSDGDIVFPITEHKGAALAQPVRQGMWKNCSLGWLLVSHDVKISLKT